MRVLLDTCVVSELRRADADPMVRAAIERVDDDDIFISVVTIGEISKGVALMAQGRRKTELARWAGEIEARYAENIIAIDRAVARTWGELSAAAARAGRTLATPDGLISATAKVHGMTVVTRNVRDFEFTGVPVLNPWRLQ